MKKTILLLVLAAFVGATFMPSDAQAAAHQKTFAAKNVKHSHKSHKSHKGHGKSHHHKNK